MIHPRYPLDMCRGKRFTKLQSSGCARAMDKEGKKGKGKGKGKKGKEEGEKGKGKKGKGKKGKSKEEGEVFNGFQRFLQRFPVLFSKLECLSSQRIAAWSGEEAAVKAG